MTDENKLDYSGTIAAARKGDENSFEFLYNMTILKYRAICMKYFDPATAEGRDETDAAIQDIYIRLYEGLKTLGDGSDFLAFGASVAERVCRRRAASKLVKEEPGARTLQLEDEPYIAVETGRNGKVVAAAASGTMLSTAAECRLEMKADVGFGNEAIGASVLSVLHMLTPAQRLELLLWNADYGAGAIAREVNRPADVVIADLRTTFAAVEKYVMDMEKEQGLDVTKYAKYRLSYFNWLLDRYNRFYEAGSRLWEEAPEVLYALALTPEGSFPKTVEEPEPEAGETVAAKDLFGKQSEPAFQDALKRALSDDSMLVNPGSKPMAFEGIEPDPKVSPAEFDEVWRAIRKRFYLRNDPVAIGHREKDPLEDDELAGLSDNFHEYLGVEGADTVEEEPGSGRKHFLGTWWGKLLLGILIIVVVLAGVVAVAGQHTSHALESFSAEIVSQANVIFAFCAI